MVAGQELATSQVVPVAAAVLAGVLVAREQEGVGDLPAEATRNVHEAHKADDRRKRDVAVLRAERTGLLRLENFRLAVQHQAHRATGGYDGQRLVGGVQREAVHRRIGCREVAGLRRPRSGFSLGAHPDCARGNGATPHPRAT